MPKDPKLTRGILKVFVQRKKEMIIIEKTPQDPRDIPSPGPICNSLTKQRHI
jgi:hypothetical protein